MEENNNLQPHNDVIDSNVNPISFAKEEPVHKEVPQTIEEVKEEVIAPIATEQVEAVKPVEFVSQPVQSQPVVQPVAVAPAPIQTMQQPKKSKAPGFIIFLLLLVIGGMVAYYFYYIKPRMESLEQQLANMPVVETEKHAKREDPGLIQQMPSEDDKEETVQGEEPTQEDPSISPIQEEPSTEEEDTTEPSEPTEPVSSNDEEDTSIEENNTEE